MSETLPPSVLARYPRNGRTAREAAERVGMSVRTAQRWTSERKHCASKVYPFARSRSARASLRAPCTGTSTASSHALSLLGLHECRTWTTSGCL